MEVSIARAFHAQTDAAGFSNEGDIDGTKRFLSRRPCSISSRRTAPFKAAHLNGPEFAIFDTNSSLERANFINDAIYGAIGSYTKLDFTPVSNAGTPDQMLTWLDTLFMHSTMPDEMKQTILTAVNAVDPDEHEGAGAGRHLPGDVVIDVSGPALNGGDEMTHHSRRDFMRLSCCSAAGAALVGGLSKFGLVSALAQGATDYKALVCIFLFGGNDSNNMIVPIDSRYTAYQQARAQYRAFRKRNCCRCKSAVRQIMVCIPTCRNCRPSLTTRRILPCWPTSARWCSRPRSRPIRQYKNLPENLYSHSDQQDQWQSAQLVGTPNAGWAGKVADNVQADFNSAAQFPPGLVHQWQRDFLHRRHHSSVHNESRIQRPDCRDSTLRRRRKPAFRRPSSC